MTNRTDQPGPELAVVYRRAAQIVQGRGHTKEVYQRESGEVCTVGALVLASGMDPDDYEGQATTAVEFFSSRLWVAIGDQDPVERIAEWNDKPERTPAEVVAELIGAARAIEERHANAVVPVCLRTPDGAVFELSEIPAHGDPRYVLAGCELAPPSVFAELGELIGSFGAVPAGSAS